ncbi:MAG TPA: glycosyltransferase family 4 protein [Chthoniobacterales bacterium]
MHILLVSSSSGSRGGGELFLLTLGQTLQSAGHDVTLWASAHPRMDELTQKFAGFGQVHRDAYKNTYDRRLRSFSDACDILSARRVAASWAGLQADVIHLNKQNLEDGLDLVLATCFAGRPSVCTIHVTQTARYLRARFGSTRDAVARLVLRQYPGRLIAIGASRFVDLQRFLGLQANIGLIENGVRIPSRAELLVLRRTTRARLGLNDGQLLGLGVGRMVDQKRPLLFLEQAALVRARCPEAAFCWVGDGPLRVEWDRTAGRLAIASALITPGWTDDVLPYYAAADFFLHTAAYEGLPLAVLEALAAGLPCVVTPNLYEDLKFLQIARVLQTDPPGWENVLADPRQRAEIGERGRELATGQYSLERMAQEYVKAYASALTEAMERP